MIANDSLDNLFVGGIDGDADIFCQLLNIDKNSLCNKCRVHSFSLRRAMIVALLYQCGYINRDIANHLGYDRSATYHCIKVYEDGYAPKNLLQEYTEIKELISIKKRGK